jgi:asparagine synthetase B (glutamine-hydrolysing)
MPGLVGIVQKHTRGPLDRGLFQRMVAVLRHRPWYQVNTYFGAEVAIARLHLNIINPAPQPYISANGRVKVFLHGEIYNDEANEANQLEFIAGAYERFGLDFAAQLNGSFVVLLIDEAADTLVVATDRAATKPVFYYLDGSSLYFAPEPKALALIPSLAKRLNLTAVASFLACGHYLNGQVLLEDIRHLDNATILTVSPAGVMIHKYWDYTFNEGLKDRGSAYYQAALSELIRRAVRRRMRGQHRQGILLSGGYDSRGILACYLAEHPREPVATISWGVAEDSAESDCAVAKRLAIKLNLPHTFYPLRIAALPQHLHDFVSLHDGLTDACTNYPESLKIFTHIREELGLQVILRGDECFGFSSPACNERTIFDKYSILPLHRSQIFQKLLKKPWLLCFSDLIIQTISNLALKCPTNDVILRQSFLYFDQRLKYYINHLNYIKSFEIEVRTPYLDNDILDFMRELPSKYHYGKMLYRRALREAFPNIFDEMAKKSNLPNLSLEFKRNNLNDFIYQHFLKEEHPLLQCFDLGAIHMLFHRFFSTSSYKDNDDRLTQKLGKLFKQWPILYTTLYNIYLPIQDKQKIEVISLPAIILRVLTLDVYLKTIGVDQSQTITF